MPTPKIMGVAPVLVVDDVQAAAAYWRDKLGFTFTKIWGDPPNFCMPQRDGMLIMLSQAPSDWTIVPHWQICPQLWNAYFWVDDAKALFEEFQRTGARFDYDLDTKTYGVIEFGIQDLDGHSIAFGQELED